jgi:hypothetical protein
MVFFSLFVIGAVILGAGAMLSPAWPSKEPRIGLSATFILSIIAGGAVWWTELFGWDTLIIDYLLFGIVSLVILGGTLSRGGGENSEAGWPSRGDLAFLGLALLICMMPLFVLRLPLGEAAASDALITLAVRESGSFTSLAPYYPETRGFAPPAFHALAAYLSQALRQGIPTIHMALGSLIAFLCVWTVYDLGAEIRDKRLGRAMAVALLGSFGMPGLLWQSYYSQLMGVLFAFAFLTYALRYYRQHKVADMVAAGLMLGMVLYASPMLFALCLVGYYLGIFLLNMPMRQPSKTVTQWTVYSQLGLWFGLVVVVLFGTGIWITKNWDYLNETYYMVLGDYYTLSDDKSTWVQAFYALSASILGGYGLAKLSKHFEPGKYAYWFMGIAVAGIIGIVFYLDATVHESTTENDMAAMQWIKDNTPEEILILNHPHDLGWMLRYEEFTSTLWVTSYGERKSIFSAKYTCFVSCPYGADIVDFWVSPTSSQNVLYSNNIDYVLIPDGLDFPQAVEGLRLVFEEGGARVYEVAGEE